MADAEKEKVIQNVIANYRDGTGPYEKSTDEDSSALPVEKVWTGMFGTRPQSLYLTLSTALNYYGKEAETLRWRTKGLWEQEHWIYEPTDLVGNNRYQDLFDLFKGQGTYKNHPVMEEHGLMEGGKGDVDIWYTISATLFEEYDSNPMNLLESNDFNARKIFDRIQQAEREEPAHERSLFTKSAFPYLAGSKVGPLWLRLIDDLVHPLDDLELLPLPVDSQIVKVTNHLFDTSYPSDPSDSEKAEIRELWEPFCEENNISTAEVDDAFWRIGEQGNWDKWGEEYLDDPENWSASS